MLGYLSLKLIKHEKISRSSRDMQASMTNWARICANKTASSSAISFATRSEFWNAGKIFWVCLDHITMTAKHCPVLHVLSQLCKRQWWGEAQRKKHGQMSYRRSQETTQPVDNLCVQPQGFRWALSLEQHWIFNSMDWISWARQIYSTCFSWPRANELVKGQQCKQKSCIQRAGLLSA